MKRFVLVVLGVSLVLNGVLIYRILDQPMDAGEELHDLRHAKADLTTAQQLLIAFTRDMTRDELIQMSRDANLVVHEQRQDLLIDGVQFAFSSDHVSRVKFEYGD